MPAASASARMSLRRTGTAACSAISWAMPPPITPAPSTATSRTARGVPPGASAAFFASSVSLKTWSRFLHTGEVASSASGARLRLEPGRCGPARCRCARPRWRAAAPGSCRGSPRACCLRAWSKSTLAAERVALEQQLLEVGPLGSGGARLPPRCASAKSRTRARNWASGSSASASPIFKARLAAHRLAGEDHVERGRDADPPRQPRAAAPGGQDPEPHLGQSDAQLGAVADAR